MRRVVSAAVVVLVATAFAHLRGLAGEFVYDDHRFIERNHSIDSLEQPQRFFTDPRTASAAQGVEPDVWRPIRTLDFAVDVAVFGRVPRPWHAMNVFVHLANALLVFVLLVRLLDRREGQPTTGTSSREPGEAETIAAAAGALLFSLHPVSVESVAWVSSRGDLLAWFFVLLALEVGRRRGMLATVATVVLVALGCLAKESAVVAFALLPLHHVALPRESRPSRSESVTRTVALFVATAGYFVARNAVMPTAADLSPFAQTTFPDGSRTAAARGFLSAVAGYAKSLLFPFGFPFDRNVYTDPVPLSFADPSVVIGLGILVATLGGGVRALVRGGGAVAFACLGSLVVLVPVSNVLVPLKTFSAERFLYPLMPCLAAGVAAGGLALARASVRGSAIAVTAAAALVLIVLGLLTDSRTASWRDDLTLWTAVQRESPMNPRAYEGIGFERLRAGHLSQAEAPLRTYLEFQPYDGKAHALLAAELRAAYDDLLSIEGSAESSDESQESLRIPPFLLRMAIEESRAAVRVWSRLGLERGRGDLALRRATLKGWRDSALDASWLSEARRANTLLAQDDVRLFGAVQFEQRRIPVLLARLALGVRRFEDPTKDLARRRERTDALEAIGIDASTSDPDAYARLLPMMDALVRERPGDEAMRRNRVEARERRVLALPLAAREEELRAIEEDLVYLLQKHPNETQLRRELAQLRELIGR